MFKDDIEKKIHEYEQEVQRITMHDYHRNEYKKLLNEKIESYKRLLPKARKKKEWNPLWDVFGKKPKTKGDASEEREEDIQHYEIHRFLFRYWWFPFRDGTSRAYLCRALRNRQICRYVLSHDAHSNRRTKRIFDEPTL